MFDLLNDFVPARYKAKLQSRSYREGASRSGETLKVFAEDRRKPKDRRQWSDYVGE